MRRHLDDYPDVVQAAVVVQAASETCRQAGDVEEELAQDRRRSVGSLEVGPGDADHRASRSAGAADPRASSRAGRTPRSSRRAAERRYLISPSTSDHLRRLRPGDVDTCRRTSRWRWQISYCGTGIGAAGRGTRSSLRISPTDSRRSQLSRSLSARPTRVGPLVHLADPVLELVAERQAALLEPVERRPRRVPRSERRGVERSRARGAVSQEPSWRVRSPTCVDARGGGRCRPASARRRRTRLVRCTCAGRDPSRVRRARARADVCDARRRRRTGVARRATRSRCLSTADAASQTRRRQSRRSGSGRSVPSPTAAVMGRSSRPAAMRSRRRTTPRGSMNVFESCVERSRAGARPPTADEGRRLWTNAVGSCAPVDDRGAAGPGRRSRRLDRTRSLGDNRSVVRDSPVDR